MRSIFTHSILLYGILLASTLKAQVKPDLTGIVTGKNILHIEIESDKELNTTLILFHEFDSEFKFVGTSELKIDSFTSSNYTARPLYSAYNSNQLVSIEVRLIERASSKSSLVIGVTPDYKLCYKYTSDYSGHLKFGKLHDEDFFENEITPCMPADHINYSLNTISTEYNEQDAYTKDGGLLYLRHALNDEGDRSLSLKYDSEINSSLYYFRPTDGKIHNAWKFDLEEERILGYRVSCFGDTGYLFTSYLVGNVQKKVGEKFESRVRMFNVETGKIILNSILPEKSGFEYFFSSMTYDNRTGSVFIAFNMLSTDYNINWNKGDRSATFFNVVRIDKNGTCLSVAKDIIWENSEETIKSDAPLFLVRSMAVLKNGNVQVAGLFSYWIPEYDVPTHNLEQTQYGTSLTLAVTGICNMVYANDLVDISVKQYSFNTFDSKNSLVTVIGNLSPRMTISGTKNIDRKIGIEHYWNSASETMIILAVNHNHRMMDNDREVVALKTAKGEEVTFKTIDSMDMKKTSCFFYGFVLTDNKGYYSANNTNPRSSKAIEIN